MPLYSRFLFLLFPVTLKSSGPWSMLRGVLETEQQIWGEKKGYWTAIENVFFEAELDDGTTVLKYSAAEGHVFRDENNRYYCFVKDGAGKLYCYLQDGESLSDQLVTNTWMEGYRINGNGILNVDTTEQIDGIYYRFDSAGLGTAVTYQVTAGTNGPAAQTVMEQTEFTAGQQILVLITDAAGNVTAAPVIVGANGIIQYQIPGVSCIVRLLQTLG